MSNDWWPTLLAHIKDEAPWSAQDVVVAEVKSFDEKPHAGTRRTFSALVPIDQIDDVKAALAKLDFDVSTSGPHPFFSKDRPYQPSFGIDAVDLPSKRYEPLVLAWISHNLTTLQPDPGFLMTYGLMPRPGRDGVVHWDDPKEPRHNIVTVSPPSKFDWPLGTHAYVTIAKDFLQDYLTLRHMALVQVYWEERWGYADADAKEKLGQHEGVNIEFSDRRFQLGLSAGTEGTMFAQAWGARIVALPKDTPISADPLDEEGLQWPGMPKPVTNQIARRMGMEFGYVDDSVLGQYEDKLGFDVHPESGGVGFGTQWSVSFCRRIGRNLIRLELKKLYEGAPPSVARLWNRFAVEPVPDSVYPAILDEPNIATRAKALTYAVVGLGEALSHLAHRVGVNAPPEDFVSLRRQTLDYHGWWTFDGPKAVSHHVPLNLGRDAFLDRCMSLEKLIIEGLSEANLRKALLALGVPEKEIKDLRALKLLDAIVRLAQIASATGLNLATDGAVLWGRLATEGTQPAQPIARLFALHDVRILKAHKAGDVAARLAKELERLDVTLGEEAAGYGKILDHIYEVLAKEIEGIAQRL